MGQDFNEWFEDQDFFHDNTAREGLEEALELGRVNGISTDLMIGIFEKVMYVMRNEYGD